MAVSPAVPPPPTAADELTSISVDVICPDRLARQGFAVAAFPIRVPTACLQALESLFACLKLGALADEAEVRGRKYGLRGVMKT